MLFSFFRRNILLWMSAHVTADHTGLYHQLRKSKHEISSNHHISRNRICHHPYFLQFFSIKCLKCFLNNFIDSSKNPSLTQVTFTQIVIGSLFITSIGIPFFTTKVTPVATFSHLLAIHVCLILAYFVTSLSFCAVLRILYIYDTSVKLIPATF